MKIKDFGIEIWMNAREGDCIYNLAQTCVEPFNVEELLSLSGEKEEIINDILKMKLNYGEIDGSIRLRSAIAKLYKEVDFENVMITHGAIGANSLVFQTLLEPGDTVVTVIPTYQQHYSLPEALGAQVKTVNLTAENKYLPNIEELTAQMNDRTKLICISNPNNPTGSLMDKEFLLKIVEIAKEYDAYILCDEVYRGLTHEGESFTESIVDLYEKGISTGSMSKTFSLAGLRIGWATGPADLIKSLSKRRDYNTISCSMVDDRLAAVALENLDKIIHRNLTLVKENIEILDKWINSEPRLSYVRPKAGTTAFVKFDLGMTSEEFCGRLLEEKGVLLVPGKALDMEGYVRIGYADSPEKIKAGLEKISEFISGL
ncbi:aminotransferase [Alkalicella caledoniensis]|uniref:Aminotransferase n=1 Tax=Alkalicella caledoniensis TaxID=2731377 RepID=A0A7G9W7P5_ALKCA|nr:aminotransferase [Alkalicella caledoniensis]QNO14707.1 aminotransferase [Alkalicella caledoniensis]